jgi:hypothetical protein
VAIIGSREAALQDRAFSCIISNNYFKDIANRVRVDDGAHAFVIADNVFYDFPNTVVLSILDVASVTVSSNSFQECSGFIGAANTTSAKEAYISVHGNIFRNSLTTIRGVSFTDFPVGSFILCNDNVFSDCANDIVAYDTALGRNMLSNNLADASSTIRTVGGSAVTQSDNMF